jgi:hypothetical protein
MRGTGQGHQKQSNEIDTVHPTLWSGVEEHQQVLLGAHGIWLGNLYDVDFPAKDAGGTRVTSFLLYRSTGRSVRLQRNPPAISAFGG